MFVISFFPLNGVERALFRKLLMVRRLLDKMFPNIVAVGRTMLRSVNASAVASVVDFKSWFLVYWLLEILFSD